MTNLSSLSKTENQTTRILKLLRTKGRVSNAELNKISFRYGARIHELRNDGYMIVSNQIRKGLWEFVYQGHQDELLH